MRLTGQLGHENAYSLWRDLANRQTNGSNCILRIGYSDAQLRRRRSETRLQRACQSLWGSASASMEILQAARALLCAKLIVQPPNEAQDSHGGSFHDSGAAAAAMCGWPSEDGSCCSGCECQARQEQDTCGWLSARSRAQLSFAGKQKCILPRSHRAGSRGHRQESDFQG